LGSSVLDGLSTTGHNPLVKRKGVLIVIEGIDGAGKATQAALLAKRLRAAGVRVATFASPRYDLATGKLVKRSLKGEFGDFVGISPYFSALPYMVDFAAWRADIEIELKKGVVICDRHVYSTIAYAGAKLSGGAQKKFIKEMSDVAFGNLKLPKPDWVILLDVPVATSQRLMAKKKKDQYEKNTAYQKKVADVYATLAKGKEWRSIECTDNGAMRSRAEIAHLVWSAVAR
jgi:dTMP kinase